MFWGNYFRNNATYFSTFLFDRHGSNCAGVIASVANNQMCTVGIAFNAMIGGESTELRNWTMSFLDQMLRELFKKIRKKIISA